MIVRANTKKSFCPYPGNKIRQADRAAVKPQIKIKSVRFYNIRYISHYTARRYVYREISSTVTWRRIQRGNEKSVSYKTPYTVPLLRAPICSTRMSHAPPYLWHLQSCLEFIILTEFPSCPVTGGRDFFFIVSSGRQGAALQTASRVA